MSYLGSQIITYMGNKRKLLSHIERIVEEIKEKLGKRKLIIGDGFSGSGVVSRLFKQSASILYTNDIAGYSKTLNECYLSTPSVLKREKIKEYIELANKSAIQEKGVKYIQKYWAPQGKEIKKEERAYFTKGNAQRIDRIRSYIETIPVEYKSYLLAPLLVESSIHNNCSGHFAAFYKKEKIGHFGGKKEIDMKRITKQIKLPYPIFSLCKGQINISQMDTNKWIQGKERMDLVYYDPPYNKHPYNIYYFMLDIINNWEPDQEIPPTNRGQPKNWKRSAYNSTTRAKSEFEDLIEHTNANYILISYNNGGIISSKDMENILSKKGNVKKIFIEHKTYNRMKGMANFKRTQEKAKIKECLWLVDCRK